MIRLSNGHCFKYMVASGALGFKGRGYWWEQLWRLLGLLDETVFTTVLKTLTLQPRCGNLCWWRPWGCVRPIRNGWVNAMGMGGPGLEPWCRTIGPQLDSRRAPVMVSVAGDRKALGLMAHRLNDFDLVGVEVNVSCPNIDEMPPDDDEIVAGCVAVRSATRLPIVLKLSPIQSVSGLLPRLTGLVEALSINSVPWTTVFPNRRSPLSPLGGGGVSGRAAQPYTWRMVSILVDQTDIPVIGPSVWNFEDIGYLREVLGAQAVSFGSVFLRHPWRPNAFVRRDDANHNS